MSNDLPELGILCEELCDGVLTTVLATRGGATYTMRVGSWRDYEWDGECPRAKLFAAAPTMRKAISNMLGAWSLISEGNQPRRIREAIAKLRQAAKDADEGVRV